ncbi:MAG: UDP-3-O-[3-hydroxymyristoyl] N-acetylglucosamine deacetylase [Bdellovibrionales bacterium RIFOXYB1_FULL_37_110]|nr:MAG: UDP-3-O-[3-hydroxymyristoyl] N-acetylglucosamine deacetylase [Bdellovibrionales bacterium RIFOXYA1_FULL_38_20]OFZ48066.1 MAG: UDP-3-O-[3-hydroxymyristoyl] N-acetylglucosamine deacetylase [Bdellovibrionales bacterium RIFOXYC1_FULL_37_79]OFZ58074.1 MAG: UDP-3-O-[3-hydroxymyristoyl] N-acetylglucosamine deacetylase [Bdellovibrionales bacterium RIFOXYB1_FULL_37_110]OFZ63359.1 MAG: UDP-3-O-[3-hydroxymyristoyl] N-acetylglucosamine deacetylase [Bdellovibrionales bacterium RIFOXYD1_FULL_36_51]
MLYQRTLSKSTSVTGIGLHTGKKITLTIHPAKADFGIQFKRSDLPDAPVLKASADTVGTTENNTTIGSGVNVIHTVEHLLSVFYGLGVDNAYCEVNGPEIPIMDGSGASFVFLLKESGITNLNKSKKFLVVLEPIRVELDDKWAQIEPSSRLIVDSTIVFAHPIIRSQNKSLEFSCDNFIDLISRSRTFGFLKDVDMLKRKGLIKGGSLDNAIVLDDFKVMNSDGLRFKDEFIRHKILDTIGDISLLGYEVCGKITTYKSGHLLHNMLCRKLLESPNSYEIVSASSIQKEALEALELPIAMAPIFQ